MKFILKKTFTVIKNYREKSYENNLFKALNTLKSVCEDYDITLIDICAAGEIEPRWKSISKHLNYIGFEPDERSRKLMKNNSNCYKYFIYPNAVWEKKTKININFTKGPQVSSFYPPNANFTNLFPNPERFDVNDVISIDSVALDSFEISNLDFIKIDIQGGELNVLKGAKESLNSTIGLEIEVEFLELYKDQPLYGDLVNFLKTKDFEFIDFVNLCRWERKEHNGFGQCVFGDALFLKSPEFMILKYNNDYLMLSKYLGICLVYNRHDLIDRLIELSDKKFKDSIKPFVKSITYFKNKYKNLKFFNKVFNIFLQLFFKNTKSFIQY